MENEQSWTVEGGWRKHLGELEKSNGMKLSKGAKKMLRGAFLEGVRHGVVNMQAAHELWSGRKYDVQVGVLLKDLSRGVCGHGEGSDREQVGEGR
jgi:hypothetical protein